VFDLIANTGQLSAALAVLTAMITPAVLVTACGTLILSTSNRLGRVVNRIRDLADDLDELAAAAEGVTLLVERRAMIFTQLEKLMKRAWALQMTLRALYLAVCLFISASVAIGIVGVSESRYTWVPVLMGIFGASFLFFGSVTLIVEARLAMGTLRAEMQFIDKLRTLHAPEGTLPQRSSRLKRFRRSDA
jgi:hypothetical protein